MKKVFIVGDASSSLTYERGMSIINLGYKVYWFSTCNTKVSGAIMLGSGISQSQICNRGIVKGLLLMYHYICIKPDLVHVFYAFQGTVSTLMVLLMKNVVVTVMGSDILLQKNYHLLNRVILKKLLKQAQAITAKSGYLESRLLDFGCGKEKIYRLNWGVDLKKFRPDINTSDLRKKYGLDQDDFIIFSPRGCRPIYQNKLIIDGFNRILDASKGSKCYLIISSMGSVAYSAYYEELVGLVGDLGIEKNIIFTPCLSHTEMATFYCLSDICISIPYSDGMPQSLFEAMACQCYPLLGNLEQYKEIEENGGYYGRISEFTGNAIASAILSVFKDEEKIAKKKLLNLEFITKYANKVVETHKISQLYNGILR